VTEVYVGPAELPDFAARLLVGDVLCMRKDLCIGKMVAALDLDAWGRPALYHHAAVHVGRPGDRGRVVFAASGRGEQAVRSVTLEEVRTDDELLICAVRRPPQPWQRAWIAREARAARTKAAVKFDGDLLIIAAVLLTASTRGVGARAAERLAGVRGAVALAREARIRGARAQTCSEFVTRTLPPALRHGLIDSIGERDLRELLGLRPGADLAKALRLLEKTADEILRAADVDVLAPGAVFEFVNGLCKIRVAERYRVWAALGALLAQLTAVLKDRAAEAEGEADVEDLVTPGDFQRSAPAVLTDPGLLWVAERGLEASAVAAAVSA
jgi:hypothetical protein